MVALGTFGLTLLSELIILLYRNGLFAGRGSPRAIVSFSASESKEEGTVVKAAHVRVLLPRPVKLEPGQYINLWMPSVSLWSWMQTHPFTVTSWSKGAQDTIELLVKPRSGLTADLLRHADVAAGSSISFLAVFTGPHGVSEEVSYYESVLVLASGSGIATAIPYLKKMIYGYNTCTSQVRRLHLVWQVESVGEMTAALALLNNLLKDDIMDEGYVRIRVDPVVLPETDDTHGSRYCTSPFTSGTALSRINCRSVGMNESISTREYQIIKT